MTIKLSDILTITDLDHYKAHFAMWNGTDHPLDAFVRDKSEWREWNAYKGLRNDFNRPYIFSLMSFYHEPYTWLFGGIWKVTGLNNNKYDVKMFPYGAEFIGRLKLTVKLNGRNFRPKFENYYDKLIVKEILQESFSGKTFIGYEDIDLKFSDISVIVKNEMPDWRAALQRVKGVYLITDLLSGKRYVGSAYGVGGVWGRWREYVLSGHGGNADLKDLLNGHGITYALEYFKFTLLEFHSTRTDNDVIISREIFWKKALLTRGEFGHNRN